MSSFTHVIVIGAGAFGASTALELARLGHRVTVLERSADGRAADNAASNDLNKIIRADYSHYRDLGKKANHMWRTSPIVSKFYHETGVVFRSGEHYENAKQWVEDGVRNAVAPVTDMENSVDAIQLPQAFGIKSSDEAVSAFPPSLRPHLGEAYTNFGRQVGYYNPQGGWAESKNATFATLDEARRLGAEVITNAQVASLLYKDPSYDQKKPRVCGAVTADGRKFYADRVVLAVGCWTRSMLHTLKVPLEREVVRPTAHCVLTMKLDPEVAQKFKGTPVTFNLYTYVICEAHLSGFYTFEPNADGILKCAIHGVRLLCLLTFQRGSDFPNPADYQGSAFPSVPTHKQVNKMLKEIRTLFPILQFEGPNKNASVHFTRICWYSDSIDENFLIDFHPNVDNLLVCSGDSGHAFKFLPVLGRLTSARLLHLESGTDELVPDFGLSSHQRRVFSFAHHLDMNDPKNLGKLSTDSMRIGEPEDEEPGEILEMGTPKAKL